MTFNSTVRVPTGKASRYLQQLCKHWSHNLAVEFTEHNGNVVFPRNTRGPSGRATPRSPCRRMTTASNVA
jgi:hypothetical protein